MIEQAIEGASIAYERVDPPVSGSGLPLVLVHGFTGHRDDFREVSEALSRLAGGRCVLMPDLRGHGDSSRAASAGEYGFDLLVHDLLGWLTALEVDRCHLLGHSMGGMVTLRFALAHPSRLASLVCMNTAPRAPEGIRREGMLRAAEIARESGMAGLYERVAARERRLEEEGRGDPHRASWADHYWAHMRRRYLAMDPAAYAGLGLAMCDQISLTPRLGELTLPTSVLVGEDDEDFLAGASELAQAIPGARLTTFAGAAHHPHQENRRAWLAAIEAHLEWAEAPPA